MPQPHQHQFVQRVGEPSKPKGITPTTPSQPIKAHIPHLQPFGDGGICAGGPAAPAKERD